MPEPELVMTSVPCKKLMADTFVLVLLATKLMAPLPEFSSETLPAKLTAPLPSPVTAPVTVKLPPVSVTELDPAKSKPRPVVDVPLMLTAPLVVSVAAVSTWTP